MGAGGAGVQAEAAVLQQRAANAEATRHGRHGQQAAPHYSLLLLMNHSQPQQATALSLFFKFFSYE
jgi:hypothetical protein